MDNFWMNIVNSGIGLIKQSESNFNTFLTQLSSDISRIQSLGEADSSNYSRQVREIVSKLSRDSRSVANRTKEEYKEFLYKYINTLHSINSQLEQILREQLDKLNHPETKAYKPTA